MKLLQKALSLILVLTAALCLGLSAWAAPEQQTGSITITNAVPGAEYKVYRMFDLESFSGDAYSYKVRPENTWKDFAESIAYTETNPSGLITISNGYITPINDSNPEAWAFALIEKAKEWVQKNHCPFDGTGQVAAGESQVQIDSLPSGYYFVDTSLGTVCFLNTVSSPSLIISEKNAPPSVEKETLDNDPAMDPSHKSSDASIGDFVKFTATIHVNAGAVGYKLVDTMADGLVFAQDPDHLLTVQTNDGRTLSDPVASGAETWSLDGQDGDSGFTVLFNDEFAAKWTNMEFLVTYYGRLTQDAVLSGATAASNSAKILYGEDSKLESQPSETKTDTHDLKVVKYAEQDGIKTALAGAQFQLSTFEKLSGGAVQEPIPLTVSGTSYLVDPNSQNSTILTDESGLFTIQGLDAGTYYLHEIKSPDGYNKLTAPISITIGHDGVVTYNKNHPVTGRDFKVQQPGGACIPVEGAVPVLNQTGSELPSTGGIGTTIFYVVGSLMMLCALALLIARKKLSKTKKDH